MQWAKESDHLNEEKLHSILEDQLKLGLNATQVDILNTVHWRYFSRWSPEEMEQGRCVKWIYKTDFIIP